MLHISNAIRDCTHAKRLKIFHDIKTEPARLLSVARIARVRLQ
jgi:hypothetical protein